jgi:hypothetical protein
MMMEKIPKRVSVLEKINLLLSVRKLEEEEQSGYQEWTLSFIYGLAAGGLTPFEQDLADKAVGETLLIRISISRLHNYFQGLELPPLLVPAGQEIFFLQVRIVGVEAVSQRELIGEMAAITQCGHDGGECCS